MSDLRDITNSTVYGFNSLDSSLTFTQENESTKIFLIISGAFREMYRHYFLELPQIVCVYVFCYDRAKHEDWAKTDKKIRGVFDDKTQLLAIVSREVKSFTCRWSFLDESSFQKASTTDGRWYQLFIRILIHQPRTDDAWNQMLNECRLFYREQGAMQKQIDKFEKGYTVDQAINYYRDDSFVYRIINHALRTHNIDIIIKFQPFISDLYNELNKRYLRHTIDIHMRNRGLPIRVVYRGQYMPEVELERLKDYCKSRNSHIVLNAFGSATRCPEVAFQFIPVEWSGYVRCFYQIIIPDYYYTTVNKTLISLQQFVDVAESTSIQDEQEVLFNVGSLFRIKYIGQPTLKRSWVPIVLELYADVAGFDSCWDTLSMRMQDETDERKKDSLEFVQKYTNKGNELNWAKWWLHLTRECCIRKLPDESVATIMYEGFDDPESTTKAVELRKRFYMSNNPFMLQSGTNNFRLSEIASGKPTRIIALYDLFLEYSGENIELLQCDVDDPAKSFQCIGDAYAKFHFNTENALNCYRKALEFAKSTMDN